LVLEVADGQSFSELIDTWNFRYDDEGVVAFFEVGDELL